MTPPRSDWRADAECARTDIYHPDTWVDDPSYAQEVCLTRCPVVAECRAWALRSPGVTDLIAGGMTEKERRTVRRREAAARKRAAKKEEAA